MPILRITAHNINEHEQHVNSFIRKVFGDTPWNQYIICPVCKMHWGLKEKEDVKSHGCKTTLKPYWLQTEIEVMLRQIPKHPQSSFWITYENREYKGCTWGFSESLKDVAQRLNLDEDNFPPNLKGSLIGYQAAMAVDQNVRDKGIAGILFKKREEDFLSHNVSHYVVRTIYDSIMYHWLIRKGYRVFYTYPKEPRYTRVLMYR